MEKPSIFWTIHVHTQTDGQQDRHGNKVLNVNIKMNVTYY